MKKANLIWSLLLTMALFFNGPLSQTAFAHYMDQPYEEEMFCDEEEEQPCSRSLWIGGGVLGLAAIGAIACTLSKHRNHDKGCHQHHCCNEISDNGGNDGAGQVVELVLVGGEILEGVDRLIPIGTTVKFYVIDPLERISQIFEFTITNNQAAIPLPEIRIENTPRGKYTATLDFEAPEGQFIPSTSPIAKTHIQYQIRGGSLENYNNPPVFLNFNGPVRQLTTSATFVIS